MDGQVGYLVMDIVEEEMVGMMRRMDFVLFTFHFEESNFGPNFFNPAVLVVLVYLILPGESFSCDTKTFLTVPVKFSQID